MKFKVLKFLSLCLMMVFSQAWAAEEPVSTTFFGNLAAGGYDSVAYHRLAKGDEALKGDDAFVVEWKGAKWRFLNEKDAKAFAENPEKYSPAYNGHCANALSIGEGLVKTNGKHWAIFDDQLYLFYAPRGEQRWSNGDYKAYKQAADQAWADILAK